jgi:hypothetical protein
VIVSRQALLKNVRRIAPWLIGGLGAVAIVWTAGYVSVGVATEAGKVQFARTPTERPSSSPTASGAASDPGQIALSRQLAAQAISNIDRLDLSLLLSLEALRVADTVEARASLLKGLQAQPELIEVVRDNEPIRDAAFAADGKTLTVLESNTVRRWDIDRGA